jgi:uncharacterized protein (TIGR00369 family)
MRRIMASTDRIDIEAARQALASQPFSRLLGARITAFAPDGTVMEIDIRDDLRQQNGYLHGGVLSYAADNALTFAAGTVLGMAVLTEGFTIDFLRPAQGRILRAHATVVHSGRRRAVCRCDLYAVDDKGDSKLCATAQGSALTINGVPDPASAS